MERLISSDANAGRAALFVGGQLAPKTENSVRAGRSRDAFTLVEILVVIGILAILSGISFTLMSPMRESARQRSCASQLRQIYTAAQLYSSDNPGPEQYPGLGDFRLPLHDIEEYGVYLKSEDVFFCPDGPEELKKTYASTYMMSSAADLDPEINVKVGSLAYRLDRQGLATPFVQCTIHDEYYYAPRESVDPAYAQPFLVQVWFDGSLHVGRTNEKRIPHFKDIVR